MPVPLLTIVTREKLPLAMLVAAPVWVSTAHRSVVVPMISHWPSSVPAPSVTPPVIVPDSAVAIE